MEETLLNKFRTRHESAYVQLNIIHMRHIHIILFIRIVQNRTATARSQGKYSTIKLQPEFNLPKVVIETTSQAWKARSLPLTYSGSYLILKVIGIAPITCRL